MDLRRALNSFMITLTELRDRSNVEMGGGFISLSSLFGVSVCLSSGYISQKNFMRNCLLLEPGYFIIELLNKT